MKVVKNISASKPYVVEELVLKATEPHEMEQRIGFLDRLWEFFNANGRGSTKQYWDDLGRHLALDNTGKVYIRTEVERLRDEVNYWKERAAKHGCNIVAGDDDCG